MDPKMNVCHIFFHSFLFPLFSFSLPFSSSLGFVACVHRSVAAIIARVGSYKLGTISYKVFCEEWVVVTHWRKRWRKKKKEGWGQWAIIACWNKREKRRRRRKKKKGGGEGGRDVARLWLQCLQQAMQAYPPLLPSSSSPKARAKLGLVWQVCVGQIKPQGDKRGVGPIWTCLKLVLLNLFFKNFIHVEDFSSIMRM